MRNHQEGVFDWQTSNRDMLLSSPVMYLSLITVLFIPKTILFVYLIFEAHII